MLYKVKAKYKEDKLKDFFRMLTNGTIKSQRPDGSAIIKAMKEAKITDSDEHIIEWYETCFCPTPLAHETNTVYKHFLTDIETVESEKVRDDIKGKPFFDLYFDLFGKKLAA